MRYVSIQQTIQSSIYARLQILVVHLDLWLFWSGGTLTDVDQFRDRTLLMSSPVTYWPYNVLNYYSSFEIEKTHGNMPKSMQIMVV